MAGRYRVDLLQDELAGLCNKMEDIIEAVVISLDGFVVASHPPASDLSDEPHLNTMAIAATAGSVISHSQNILERLKQGNIERLLVEGTNGAMMIYPISQTDAALVAMVTKDVKMGLTSLAMRKSITRLSDILTGEYSR
ncbi:MAG: roadblock/LC7 domain-containing protein [Anaerolineales bacterium]|nr:roadblock/LC7 domain-containing protein [Anaerolineales bacterium]